MNTRPPMPDIGKSTRDQCEIMIEAIQRIGSSMTRAQAARAIMNAQPRWYWQTTEGEYLEWVARGEK